MVPTKFESKICRYSVTYFQQYAYCINIIADGQYLASRLSKSTTQQSSLMKGLLKKFNALPSVTPSQTLTWADATDLSSMQWLRGVLATDVHIPKKVKLDAIKHHHLVLRGDEEVHVIEEEMKATLSFYLQDWHQLINTIEGLKAKPCTCYNNGALTCLQLARLKCEGTLRGLISSFSRFLDLTVDMLPTERFMLLPNVDLDHVHPDNHSSSPEEGSDSSCKLHDKVCLGVVLTIIIIIVEDNTITNQCQLSSDESSDTDNGKFLSSVQEYPIYLIYR